MHGEKGDEGSSSVTKYKGRAAPPSHQVQNQTQNQTQNVGQEAVGRTDKAGCCPALQLAAAAAAV